MKNFKYLSILSILFLFIACGADKNNGIFVPANNADIEYMGRIGHTDSTAEIYWSGSSATVAFNGTGVSALLKDEKGHNYFNIIIDGDSIIILHPDSTKKLYPLADNLPLGKHTVQLFKRTEWTKGKTSFYGFQLSSGAELLKIPSKKKSIEFYGNSITAGYAVEDYSGKDCPDSTNTNNYNSYAAMTARHFNANYSCIARSGIGITISWFPQVMKEMYYRLNPADPNSVWDFKKFTPDIVVINLFQNDSWLVERPEFEEFKRLFGTKKPDKNYIEQEYRNFVKSLREKYPKAAIICMLGSMDITRQPSKWPQYVKEAVKPLNDKNIYTLFIPYKNTPGHPRVKEQKVMADSLISFINKNQLWGK